MEWKQSERNNINRSEALLVSTQHTHTHSLGCMSERGESLSSVRENKLWRSSFLFSGFNTAIGVHSISKEVVGFSPLWFPRGKFFVSLVSCVLLLCMIFS